MLPFSQGLIINFFLAPIQIMNLNHFLAQFKQKNEKIIKNTFTVNNRLSSA